MKFNRIFLIVLDSLGVGETLDSETYNSKGANTLKHILKEKDLIIPNLKKLGFLNTLTMNNLESEAYYTIARPLNKGTDSISGHYEIMGIENNISFKTFSNNGFPRELLETIVKETKIGIIGNIVGDHDAVLEKLGKRQIETGSLIIYTTGDSNLEIAAHEDVIPLNQLYNYAEIIRHITMREEWKVSRVVARPFITENNTYKFTNNKKIFTLTPPNKSVLDDLKENNYQVISIGKINDLYNSHGITKIIKASNNNEAINKLTEIMDKNFVGICYVNLEDFDLYGHSRNVLEYAKAIENLDVEIPILLNKLNIDDLLIITADHGCDPTFPGTSHTRENVPVIIYSRLFKEPKQLDILESLSDIGASISENFELSKTWMGKSFLDKLK